jgi:c-di-GMP-binding flagellar brake protein YcgR
MILLRFFVKKAYKVIKDKKSKSSLRERRESNRQTGKNEQRYYIRIDVSVPTTLSIRKKGAVEKIKAYVKNVSASGMMIHLDKKLSTGVEAAIDMYAPDTLNPIHCNGKVVRVTAADKPGKHNCGIIFTHIEEDNKNTFLKFLCDTIYRSGEK